MSAQVDGSAPLDVTDNTTLRTELLACVRDLADAELLTQTSGNVSMRVSNRHMLITPSSMPYQVMEPEDLVLTDLSGHVVSGRCRPSSEVPLHVAVYAARPDLRAIVHTHSPLATTFAVLRRRYPQFTT